MKRWLTAPRYSPIDAFLGSVVAIIAYKLLGMWL